MAGTEEAGCLPSSILSIPENEKNMYNIEEKMGFQKVRLDGNLKIHCTKAFWRKIMRKV